MPSRLSRLGARLRLRDTWLRRLCPVSSRLRGVLRRWVRGFGRGVKGVAGGLYHHDCLGLAAQVAYSALFSLFPFLLLLNALVAYIPGGDRVGDWLLGSLRALVSPDSRLYEIVQQNIFVEVGALSAALLSIGAVLTVWSASGAVMVLLKAVNRAYGHEETRSWQKRRAMAAGWSVAGAVIIPIGVLLLVFGARIGNLIGRRVGYDSALHTLWVGLRWPVVFILLVGVLGIFLYLAPSKRQRWYSVLPGALFSVAAIMGVSAGLSWFVSQGVMQVRWLTYGAIGTVIVLLFWAFLIALMVLVGGEINAAVRRTVVAGGETLGDLVESHHDD
jgi:membrane protein